MIQHIHVPAPMRDGVCLSANIHYPEQGGPFPIVRIRTPYGHRGWALPNPYGIDSGWFYERIRAGCRRRQSV